MCQQITLKNCKILYSTKWKASQSRILVKKYYLYYNYLCGGLLPTPVGKEIFYVKLNLSIGQTAIVYVPKCYFSGVWIEELQFRITDLHQKVQIKKYSFKIRMLKCWPERCKGNCCKFLMSQVVINITGYPLIQVPCSNVWAGALPFLLSPLCPWE